MKVKFDKDLSFKNELIKLFERSAKSSYGKHQIVRTIKDVWIKHLEALIKEQKGGDHG